MKLFKINENQWKLMKIIENHWKHKEISQNRCKSLKTMGNQWKWMKIIENHCKSLTIIEYNWKSLKINWYGRLCIENDMKSTGNTERSYEHCMCLYKYIWVHTCIHNKTPCLFTQPLPPAAGSNLVQDLVISFGLTSNTGWIS